MPFCLFVSFCWFGFCLVAVCDVKFESNNSCSQTRFITKPRNDKKSNLSKCQSEHNFLYKSIHTIYIDVKSSWHLIRSCNFYLTISWGNKALIKG